MQGIGQGRGENYFASDAMAMVSHTSRAHFLKDKEVSRITPTSVEVWGFDGKTIPTSFQDLDISSASVEKQGFKHFMLKEIHEQPRVMSSMIKRLVNVETKTLKTVNVLEDDEIRQGIKEYSNWPTIPQLYVKGEFIGGSDIMMEMYESGELKQVLGTEG